MERERSMLEEKKRSPHRDKKILRRFFLQKKRDFYAQTLLSHRGSYPQSFQKNLITFFDSLRPLNTQVCASYRAYDCELDPLPLMKAFPNFKWAFPRIEEDDLVFYIPFSLSTLKKNRWGIQEPHPEYSQKIPLSLCQVILVPAISYDKKCHRLGRGKAYYDRALRSYQGFKIGLSHSVQVSEDDLFAEENNKEERFDVDMDAVITESFFFQTWKKKKTLKETTKESQCL